MTSEINRAVGGFQRHRPRLPNSEKKNSQTVRSSATVEQLNLRFVERTEWWPDKYCGTIKLADLLNDQNDGQINIVSLVIAWKWKKANYLPIGKLDNLLDFVRVRTIKRLNE